MAAWSRLLDDVTARSKDTTKRRFLRLFRTSIPILQSAVAAAVAWVVATKVFGHEQPFFAPIAAVISLGVSLGQRLQRAIELVVGVAVGVLVADALVAIIGRGPWQLGLVVVLAMAVAVFLGGGPLVVNQGAASAILVVALVPVGTQGGMATSRFIDALIGGVIGLLVNAVLIPVNPVVVARRAANPMLDELAGTLEDIARALTAGDRDAAAAALSRAREIETKLTEFTDALGAGSEIARIAPVRWRMRGHLALYVDAVEHIDRAVRNVRVLARRAVVMLRVGETVPPSLPAAISRLSEGVRTFRNELARGFEPLAARRGLLDAATLATEALRTEPGFSAQVVVAQLRSAVHDLLLASGLSRADADEVLGEIQPRRPRKPSS